MRKILRGLAVATVLSLPLSVAALPTSSQAAVSVTAPANVDVSSKAAPASSDAKAKARRTFAVRDLPGPNARLRIRVKPEYGNKPIIIQTRKAGKFRTTGRVRTNARGVAIRTFEGSRRGIRYRLIAPGGNKYETAGFLFTITRRTV